VSHEHAGEGGILDMQEAEYKRLGGHDKVNLASWVKPKTDHRRFVSRLLQVRAHLILCFRAEEKIEMVKGADGKMEVRKKQTATGLDGWTPISEKSLPYELTCSFLLMASKPGVPIPIKLQEQHRAIFPLDQAITERSGQQLAAWAKGGRATEADRGAQKATATNSDTPSPASPNELPNPAAPVGVPDQSPDETAERSALIEDIVSERQRLNATPGQWSSWKKKFPGTESPRNCDLAILSDFLKFLRKQKAA